MTNKERRQELIHMINEEKVNVDIHGYDDSRLKRLKKEMRRLSKPGM